MGLLVVVILSRLLILFPGQGTGKSEFIKGTLSALDIKI